MKKKPTSSEAGLEIRQDPTPERYSIVDNNLIENQHLSPEAKITAIYIFSRPPKWRITMPDLERFLSSAVAKCGREKRRRILRELCNQGYMTLYSSNDLVTGQIRRYYQAHKVPRKHKKAVAL